MTMTGEVVVLEPGDEQAQKIAKAMASQTASDILSLLALGTKSLTDITGQLENSPHHRKYHAGNLLDAGLIKVAETRYSIKGREVKMYTLTDRLLIVAPKRTNVRDLLLKYSSLFGIVIAGTLAVFAIVPLLSSQALPEAAPLMTAGAESGAGMYAAKAVGTECCGSGVTPRSGACLLPRGGTGYRCPALLRSLALEDAALKYRQKYTSAESLPSLLIYYKNSGPDRWIQGSDRQKRVGYLRLRSFYSDCQQHANRQCPDNHHCRQGRPGRNWRRN